MRVLHVIPGIAPRYGGPSAVILPMCAALARLGVQVEIATTDADGAGHRLDSSSISSCPVPVHLFRRDFSERWKYSRGLSRALSRHASDYDILHVHALWSFATTAACAAGRRHGTPVIVRPCGMLSPYTWGRSAWKKQLYWWAVERRNLAGARAIHVTSTAEAAEVRALRLPATVRTVIVPNGVDAAAWGVELRPDHLRQRCGGRAGDRPIVLFLSRLHPKKGIVRYLLPAFARLKTDAFLAIAGGADEHAPEHEAEVQAAVQQLGLDDRVALLGPVSPDERWWLYDGAAVFVLPSRSENFGIVVTEAMARGVPVVVSNAVQACEHVKQAGGGRIVSLDEENVATALDEILTHMETGKILGQNGRGYVRRHLSWDRIAATLLQLYNTTASSTLASNPCESLIS
jgi:glycosyltransferase involved in cell wall biosynthesis